MSSRIAINTQIELVASLHEQLGYTISWSATSNNPSIGSVERTNTSFERLDDKVKFGHPEITTDPELSDEQQPPRPVG